MSRGCIFEDDIDYRELRVKAQFTLAQMADFFGLKDFQSYKHKEMKTRSFTKVEREYLFLITNYNQNKKIIDLKKEFFTFSEWFNILISNLKIKPSYSLISKIFINGGLKFIPTKENIINWLNTENNCFTFDLFKSFIIGLNKKDFVRDIENENFFNDEILKVEDIECNYNVNFNYNDINYREIRNTSKYTLDDLCNIFGIKYKSNYLKKETGVTSFSKAETEYFLLITNNHPTQKLVNVKDNNYLSVIDIFNLVNFDENNISDEIKTNLNLKNIKILLQSFYNY